MQPQGQPLNKNLAVICGTIIVICILISGTILLGKNSKNDNSANQQNNNGNQQQNGNQKGGPVEVSMDDDAVLGSANAPVTLIEFSDYECPFCKRHFMEVYPQIKKDYIDTGKVKLVFRDFIAVQGHNPLATSEAMAAECAGDQGGDSAYFKYHDEIFKRTTSGGSGLSLSELPNIARSIGLNAATFQNCLDSNKFKNEVSKDNADASKAGVSGTPSFFVGKSTNDGVIQGTIIVGAQPYSAFQAALDQALGN